MKRVFGGFLLILLSFPILTAQDYRVEEDYVWEGDYKIVSKKQQLEDLYGIINTEGDVILPLEYNAIMRYQQIYVIGDDTEGKRFILDEEGNRYTKFAYTSTDIEEETEVLFWHWNEYNKAEDKDSTIKELARLKHLKIITIVAKDTDEKLPESIGELESLEALELIGFNVETLPPSLNKLEGLKSLQIKGTHLWSPKLEDDIELDLASLKQLTALSLTDQSISNIPSFVGDLTNLMYLDLSVNKYLEETVEISKLEKLRYLDLHATKLSTLPEGIDQLADIKILNLQGVLLETFPDHLACTNSLNQLDLSTQNIEYIPPILFQCSNLEHLYLQGRTEKNPRKRKNYQVITADDLGAIFSMTKLKMLEIRDYETATDWTEIINLKNLESLTILGCNIEKWADDLSSFTRLHFLFLSSNNLIQMPSSIGDISSLESLYFTEEGVTSLPQSLTKLGGLYHLALNVNSLKGDWDGSIKILSEINALSLVHIFNSKKLSKQQREQIQEMDYGVLLN